MIYVDNPCDLCKNQLGLINGWRVACKAFPEGRPRRFQKEYDVRTLPECANGYKWEPRDEKGGKKADA